MVEISRKTKLIAGLCCAAIIALIVLPIQLGALTASSIFIYLFMRCLPRDISWIPCIFLAMIIAISLQSYIFQGYPENLDTIKLINRFFISIFVVFMLACICYVPKTISWLPCLLLFMMLGGMQEGLHVKITAYRNSKNNEAAKAAVPQEQKALDGLQKK
jgi:hypothetical protein